LNLPNHKSKPMKKIACIALLALLFTNCKKNNSDEELKSVTKPVDTIVAIKEEKKADKNEDCKDIEVEMGSGRECILKDTDLIKFIKIS